MAKGAVSLYVRTLDHLVRLNITDLLDEEIKESSNSISKAEMVLEFLDYNFPIGMGYMVVNSQVYLVGGERLKPAENSSNFLEGSSNFQEGSSDFLEGWSNLIEEGWIRPQYEEWLNFEVFTFDPKATLSIRRCEDTFPKLNGPKTRPLVATIEGKIYVLCREPYFGELSELRAPRFEVFDPLCWSWKVLPEPPFFSDDSRSYVISQHYAWAHRLAVAISFFKVFVFDTRRGIWERANDINIKMPRLDGVTEYKGFVFGMPLGGRVLFSYRLGPDGFPILVSGHMLKGPEEMLMPYLEMESGFVTNIPGHDDLKCSVYPVLAGINGVACYLACVTVFRVSISPSDDGECKLVLTAICKATKLYDVSRFLISSPALQPAFIIWDDLEECIKDDSSCLRPLLRRPVMALKKDPEVHNLHHRMENGQQCVSILCSTRMLVPSLLE